MRILIIDDQPRAIAPARKAFEREGHTVDVATDGTRGIALALAHEYDVIVLDVIMPGLDGIEVLERLRRRECWAPVMLLTGRDSTDDRVLALDAGADDFVAKPFELKELLARARSLARRKPQERATVLQVDDLKLDPGARTVTRGDVQVSLSAREFALLELFMRRAGQVLPREKILSAIWGYDYDGISNVIDVYVRYLRKKLDSPFNRDSIEAVRGVGYRFKLSHEPAATNKSA